MSGIIYRCAGKEIKDGGETILCGIINATPDSFSDGGKYEDIDNAVKRVGQLVDAGVKMIDVGGESTRPGSEPVDAKEEISRVVPVIKAVRKAFPDVLISCDTFKSETAAAAVKAGADIINDITGLAGDANMAETVRETGAGLILMFNPCIVRPEHPGSVIFPKFKGNPEFEEKRLEQLAELPVADMMDGWFDLALEIAKKHGIDDDQIMLDPGIGFGLTKNENLELIGQLDRIKERGFMSFLGVSRKRFVVNLLSEAGFEASTDNAEGIDLADEGSAYLTAIAAYKGVNVLRIHTAEYHGRARIIGDAIRMCKETEDRNFGAYGRRG